jgi:hypothetical protein
MIDFIIQVAQWAHAAPAYQSWTAFILFFGILAILSKHCDSASEQYKLEQKQIKQRIQAELGLETMQDVHEKDADKELLRELDCFKLFRLQPSYQKEIRECMRRKDPDYDVYLISYHFNKYDFFRSMSGGKYDCPRSLDVLYIRQTFCDLPTFAVHPEADNMPSKPINKGLELLHIQSQLPEKMAFYGLEKGEIYIESAVQNAGMRVSCQSAVETDVRALLNELAVDFYARLGDGKYGVFTEANGGRFIYYYINKDELWNFTYRGNSSTSVGRSVPELRKFIQEGTEFLSLLCPRAPKHIF